MGHVCTKPSPWKCLSRDNTGSTPPPLATLGALVQTMPQRPGHRVRDTQRKREPRRVWSHTHCSLKSLLPFGDFKAWFLAWFLAVKSLHPEEEREGRWLMFRHIQPRTHMHAGEPQVRDGSTRKHGIRSTASGAATTNPGYKARSSLFCSQLNGAVLASTCNTILGDTGPCPGDEGARGLVRSGSVR